MIIMTLKRPKGSGVKIPRKLSGRKPPKSFGKIKPKKGGKKWIPTHTDCSNPRAKCAPPRPPGVGPKSGPKYGPSFPWRFQTP